MTISRRTILKSGLIYSGCLALGGNLVVPAWSNTSMEKDGRRIDVLSDGHLQLPASTFVAGTNKAEYEAILTQYGVPRDVRKPDCNLTLYRDGERTILFDVGSGPNFMNSAGKILDAFDAIDVSPEDVTHVVFTHGHPDHLWGILDDFDDPMFPNAGHYISSTEWDYWTNPQTVQTIAENRQMFAAGAMRLLGEMEDQFSRFDFDQEFIPNVMSIDTSGHTPGHTSFELQIGGESLVIVGDAITNHHISFEKPAWGTGSDQDIQMGIKSRTRLLDKLAVDKSRLIGFHLPYPGIGHAEKNGDAYRFVAAT